MTRHFKRDPSHGGGEPPAGASGMSPDPKARQPESSQPFKPSADGQSTEPRGQRAGKPTSQGLAGAQGSGGGAERGINEAPRARPADHGSASAEQPDNSGLDPSPGGIDSK